MADFSMVEPAGWTMSLHSIYSAYIGFFQIHNIPWYDRSWGHFFSSFGEFLSFSWPVITLTDAETGQAHIVTRQSHLNAFIKMVKTRFGETLPTPPNILQVTPFSNAHRHVRNIADFTSYKKLHATLPAAELSAVKTRIRAGDPSAILPLWRQRTKTFFTISFTWSERNEKSCLEWGYAAARCGVLDSQDQWPPVPDLNYRVGHYVTAEYSSKTINRMNPTYPWAYAFGDTQVLGKAQIPQVVSAVVTSLASPENETTSNTLVLVTYGGSTQLLSKLEELGVKLPSNVFVVDAQALERNLYTQGRRGEMVSRQPNTSMSFDNIVRSLLGVVGGIGGPIPVGGGMVTPHNSGNEAFLALMAFQMLVEPETTKVPNLASKNIPMPPITMPLGVPAIAMPMAMSLPVIRPSSMVNRYSMPHGMADVADEFGQMKVGFPGSPSPSRENFKSRSRSPGPGRQLGVQDPNAPRMRTLSGNALRK